MEGSESFILPPNILTDHSSHASLHQLHSTIDATGQFLENACVCKTQKLSTPEESNCNQQYFMCNAIYTGVYKI